MDFRNPPKETMSTDDDTTPDNCGRDRKVDDKSPVIANRRDWSCDVCNNDGPMAQRVAAVELPKPPATSDDCCRNSTSCLWPVCRILKVSRSNPFHAASEYFVILNLAHGGSTDCDFSDGDRD